MIADGVFSGGGVKALAFAGALEAADDHAHYNEWDELAGTSAGAITAMALAVGYSASDLTAALCEPTFGKLADWGRPRPLRVAANLVRRRALTRGDALRDWIGSLLANAPHPAATFGELEGRLRVVGSDIVNRRMVVFPDDVGKYRDERGRIWNPDDYPIAQAVRISAGYPYMFPPIVMRDARSGQDAALVDGGIVGSYPVFLFDVKEPNHATWGFRLHDGREVPRRGLRARSWPLDMIRGLLDTSMHALDELQLKSFPERTVWIPSGAVPTLQFKLSDLQRTELHQAGYKAAREFFASAPSGRNSFGIQPPRATLPPSTQAQM